MDTINDAAWQAEREKLKAKYREQPSSSSDGRQTNGAYESGHEAGQEPWSDPDLGVLTQGRRDAPQLPIQAFGPFWSDWIAQAAEGANCSIDYCAMPLIGAAAALIGNTRTVSAWPGCSEPCISWMCLVGDPSSNKSPGIDPTLDLIRRIEVEMADSFDETHRQWETESEIAKANYERWKLEVREATKEGKVAPTLPKAAVEPDEPTRPRVVVNDSTPEKLGELEAVHPKGLMFFRDELAGWFGAFDRYGGKGAERAFWIEAFGGREHTIDRVKSKKPIRIPHHSVSVLGGIQPERLVELLKGPDDGLPARFLWSWPEAMPPKRPMRALDRTPALAALQKLRRLEMGADQFWNPQPQVLLLASKAADLFQQWREEHYAASRDLLGPIASAYGKAPGHLLRLSLTLEHLWWCSGAAGNDCPQSISEAALVSSARLIEDYFKPMAVRVYGDAALPEADRLSAIVARVIAREHPDTINASQIRQRKLSGLRDAAKVKLALDALIEAGWLKPAPTRAGESSGRQRADFAVNPKLRAANYGK